MKNLVQDKKLEGSRAPNEVVLKVAGPSCNLQCKYCHYREKAALFDGCVTTMSEACLESAIRQRYAAVDAGETVIFRWDGGEPLLAGLEFFQKAVSLQKALGAGRRTLNRVQTNGTLIDAKFAAFLGEEGFEVSVELDGPEVYHNRYRLLGTGGGSFAATMAGVEALQAAEVPFAILTRVHRANEDHPLEVYSFLRALGARSLRFEPVVEREANQRARDLGLQLATPPPLRRNLKCQPRVSSWSVTPPGFARFLIEIFERWVRHDVGRVEVEFFSDCLRRWNGEGSEMCEFSEHCGNELVVERDGRVYDCDRFVYPLHERGNVAEKTLRDMAHDPAHEKFAEAKLKALPEQCRRCSFRFACNGGCPKHRFSRSVEGEPGLNYLCNGYRQLFAHLDPYMQLMRRLQEKDREVAEIMAVLNRIPRAVGA